MSNETNVKRIISPLELPKSVREKLPEAQRDYEIALEAMKKQKRRKIIISVIIFIIIVGIIIAFL